MADTVTFQSSTLATPPDATVVATDDAGAAGHVQIVKLAIATDGSATAIPADANGILTKGGGTAGTAASAVTTVQGIASMTPVQVSQATASNLNMTEASGAAIKTAVEIIDDWDESDRAKVNVIVGQAGIAAGTGVDGATVPRVTLATNVALPAGTNAIGKLAANSGVDIGDVDVTSIAAGDNNIGNVDIVTLPAKKITYAASSALTQTNLDGLASSSTHVAGWESGAIDNSSNLYLDYIINAKLVTEGSGVTAGECRMYLVAEMDDSTWPDVFDGTESAETVVDTEQRDAICRLAAVSANDTGTAETVYLQCPSVAYVFNGVVPRKFVIFITQATGTTLETTGDPNQVYVKGVYLT